ADPCQKRHPLPDRTIARGPEEQQRRQGTREEIDRKAAMPAEDEVPQVVREHFQQRVAREQHVGQDAAAGSITETRRVKGVAFVLEPERVPRFTGWLPATLQKS